MEEIINSTNSVVNTVESVFGIVDNVFQKIESVKAKKLSQENYLRAYYIEVISNIELLHCLNIKKLSTISVNSELFRSFIIKFETQMGLTLLFSETQEKQNIYEFLRSKGRIDNTKKEIIKITNGKEVVESKKILYENVLQAISFTVIKIEFLKRFSRLSNEEMDIYNPIQIEKRIINIKERLIMIKNVMDKLDGIKELAR